MSSWDLWWWVILPYLALATFVVGHVWRWRYDQFGWTSRSTQLQERRLLKWGGGPLFHYGTFAAIAGHVLGILVPRVVHPVARHSRGHLPPVFLHRRHRRRARRHLRCSDPRLPPHHRAQGAGHHQPPSTGSP